MDRNDILACIVASACRMNKKKKISTSYMLSYFIAMSLKTLFLYSFNLPETIALFQEFNGNRSVIF